MVPLIIDCDPGIDDALALFLAAASPELDLRAVTTVAGNRPLDITTANARRVLDLAGRVEVPVHAGCARPFAQDQARCNLVHGADGLGGALSTPSREPTEGHASDVLAAALLASAPNEMTVVAIGPLTNLALAEIRHPGVLRRSRQLLIMGGAAFCPGNITPSAEFNFYADPMAAHIVLSAGADVKLFGLDVTSKAVMPAQWIASLGNLQGRCGKVARAMLAAYAEQDPLLHDACPVAYLLEPKIFGGVHCSVSVDWRPGPTEGHTLAWDAARGDAPFPANALVLTDVHTSHLLELVHGRLDRLQ